MIESTPPNPDRFAQHLPDGTRAATLEGALKALEERHGAGSAMRAGERYLALSFATADDVTTLYREIESGLLVAIRSGPTPKAPLFVRPCSGFAGPLTGTGSATGSVLFVAGLTVLARARAMVSFNGIFGMLRGMCTPCITVPLGPITTDISITVVARVLGFPSRVTVTVDETAQLICI